MTNWFTRGGKVLTVNGKIRGCCCGPDCSISYRVSPHMVIVLDPFTRIKIIATFMSYNGVYTTQPATVWEVTGDPSWNNEQIRIRCDSGIPHVWLWANNVYTNDLGEAPATGSLQYQFTIGGNSTITTVTAL